MLRVAFFSPLPPSVSGIADYSEALLSSGAGRWEVDVFRGDGRRFEPGSSDVAVYQIGNNADHAEAYQTALRHPGVVVLHEANLHHLIAELTIRRNDWDAYVREVEFDGGSAARVYAERVRALEVGPDYDGVPMLRRILASARGLIAHSDYVIAKARAAGYTGPAARIPHGAWIPEADRMLFRHRLGLGPTEPLVGVFGHLKPYKRISQCLRAFRRVLRSDPRVKMILVGEPHLELPVAELIRSLDLSAPVRVLGRTDIEDFVGYLAAADIVVNLRYPTVGETSGTLLRAFGLGKATIVSDVGAFSEFPDGICCKVPPDDREEDELTELLSLLVLRRDLAEGMGQRALDWVQRECSWDGVAAMYVSFLESVAEGRPWSQPEPEPATAGRVEVEPGYLRSWAPNADGSRRYLETHISRLAKTLSLIPPGGPDDRVLEMGAYLQITPALKSKLGYAEVRGCYYGAAGKVDRKQVVSANGETFTCEIDLFDAEKDRFPYPDGYFTTVLCCELIEHLPADPMFLMAEVHRILRDNGYLILTTPNIASLRAIHAILQGYHPGFFPSYLRPGCDGNARHSREYTPKEIHRLLLDAGFTLESLETGPFREEAHPEFAWVEHMLAQYGLARDLRGDGIYAVGRKTGRFRERWPDWLYS